MTDSIIVIPFRDRGIDPLRQANLETVLAWWDATEWADHVHVVDDDRSGDAQFNRSAAYNRGAEMARGLDVPVVIYAESDMLIDPLQVAEAVAVATLPDTGLVIPFTSYRSLSAAVSADVRDQRATVIVNDLHALPADDIMEDGRSIGALNVVSLATLDRVGQWDETFEGSWYDDTAMFRAFQVACGQPRWVEGTAWHLHHLPGWTGEHLTTADRAATQRNADRWGLYAAASTPEQIRELTTGAR